MTYWVLNLPFLAFAAVVALAALLIRRSPRWRAVGLAAIPLLLLTAVFDNLLVAAGIVGYDPNRISGARIGVAPLEDFAYAIAAIILLPSLWALLSPRALLVSSTAPRKEGALGASGSAREGAE